MRFRDGRLEIELIDGPIGGSVSVLAQEAVDRFRIVKGREQGEVVRVVRDAGGAIVKLYFATYPMTRDPSAFSAS